MIYFDHNATTPIIPEAKEIMLEAIDKYWGNPSSAHKMGKLAAEELEKARERLAVLLEVSPDEINFTSGGTEADNLAIMGIMDSLTEASIIISSVEHPAVRKAADTLLDKWVKCYIIPVDEYGTIKPDELKKAITERTKLISVIFANNEIGTVQPVKEIGEIAKKNGIPFHTDAVQAFGKIPVNIKENNISLMSISSHKVYGPKGCGALYLRNGVTIKPRIYGGSQEHNIRTGTQNLPAILSFVKAAEIAYNKMEEEKKHLFELTEFMYSEIVNSIDNVLRNGHPDKRLPGTLNVSFPDTTSTVIVEALDKEGICVSGGSACHSGMDAPSQILQAIGRNSEEAASGVRFSLGRSSTKEEVITVVKALKKAVDEIRSEVNMQLNKT